MTSPSGHRTEHISDAELAAYLDRNVASADRERIESHLADCDECRRHLIEARKVLGGIGRTRGLRIAATLAAAAVVLVFVRFEVWPTRESAESLFRGPTISAGITAHGPSGDVSGKGLAFVWSPVSKAASYRITVSRADATPLWSQSTTDTIVTLPPSVVLQHGQAHLWVTDALLLDGTTRSTGLREFRVTR
ncbi:MAG TPA: zf-HC2 domain-containing protein [Gemmatimonadaceae bacterium]|jgi:hypothetical protein|nr:zf-HC2 domain-containing protein [Gemmatimonadaceae bacterium]